MASKQTQPAKPGNKNSSQSPEKGVAEAQNQGAEAAKADSGQDSTVEQPSSAGADPNAGADAGASKDPQDGAAEPGNTITMVVPVAFDLLLGVHRPMRKFAKGICEMTQEEADHWYTKANGAYPYTK